MAAIGDRVSCLLSQLNQGIAERNAGLQSDQPRQQLFFGPENGIVIPRPGKGLAHQKHTEEDRAHRRLAHDCAFMKNANADATLVGPLSWLQASL